MKWILALLLIACLIGYLIGYWIQKNKKPKGKLLFSDLNGTGRAWVDPVWGIKGKPDEVWENDGRLHIVEIKSGAPKKNAAYRSHVMQLAAYMRLAEVRFGKPVEGGEIRYSNGKTFRFHWDYQMKKDLLTVLQQMRQVEETGETFVSVTANQCRSCLYNPVCEKKRYARSG